MTEDEQPVSSSLSRRRTLWLALGLLPGILWPLLGEQKHTFPLPEEVREIHISTARGMALTVWWLALCAWRLSVIGHGVNNSAELKTGREWFALLLLLNLPVAAGMWWAGCASYYSGHRV